MRKERAEIEADSNAEHGALAAIYVGRTLIKTLSVEVARQLMKHDALGAHARDELGISTTLSARPIQAALASAASFSIGAALPQLVTWLAPPSRLIALVVLASLAFSARLGGVSACAGGAPELTAAWRVTFWAGLAVATTFGVGSVLGVSA